MRSNNRSLYILLTVFLIVGVLFRFNFSMIFAHQPIGDERTYLEMEDTIQQSFWVAECCTRGFVYPMFLRVVFSFVGDNNFSGLFFLQAILDSIIALLLFFTYRKVFSNPHWGAWFVFLLYIFNPLTSTYTGMILTETLTFFLMALFLFLLVVSDRILVRLLAGTILGLLMFNRLMFVYWGVLLLLAMATYYLITRTHFLRRMMPLLLGCLLVVMYPSIANWKAYKTISPMPYIPGGTYDFLVSLRVHRWPILVSEHKQFVEPILEKDYRINFNDKEVFLKETGDRLDVAKEEIFQHPWPFVLSRIYHIPIFWDKRSFCCYYDIFFPTDMPLIRSGNIIFLSLALIGILSLFRQRKKTKNQIMLLIFSVVLIFYLTTALTLRVPEERHTMPAYPILLLFLPLGINVIKQTAIHMKSKHE